MKKNYFKQGALAALMFIFCNYNANAQLGGLKNKVKNAANNAAGGNNNNSSSNSGTTPENSSNNNNNNNNTNSTPSTNSSGSGSTSKDLNWYKVDKNTCIFSADYDFSKPKADFKSGENIFVRFAFPKSVTDVFNEKFPNHQKSTAIYNIAIAKNIDDENPIIISNGSFSVYNYEKINMLDFTISADVKTLDAFSGSKGDVGSKLGRMSIATMANNSISVQWEALASSMKGGKKDWEIFLIFSPGDKILDDRKPELVAQGKFSYTYDSKAAGSQYLANMKPLKGVQDEGMTSDMHKKFVNQIVFSKTNITKTGASESALTNNFNLGDDIYSRIFMEKSHLNEVRAIGESDAYASRANSSLLLKMFVDGKPAEYAFIGENTPKNAVYNAYELGSSYEEIPNEQTRAEKATTIMYNLSRQFKVEGIYVYDRLILDFMYAMQNLPVGPHKVKLDFVFDIPQNGATPSQQYTSAYGEEKLLATGEFVINVTEAGKVTAAKKLCAAIADLKLYNGKLVKEPNGTKYVATGVDDAKTTLMKVVESDGDWYYHKNRFGVITHRTIHGVAFLQDKKSKLIRIKTVLFTQQNNSSGGAVYGTSSWDWGGTSEAFCKECLGL